MIIYLLHALESRSMPDQLWKCHMTSPCFLGCWRRRLSFWARGGITEQGLSILICWAQEAFPLIGLAPAAEEEVRPHKTPVHDLISLMLSKALHSRTCHSMGYENSWSMGNGLYHRQESSWRNTQKLWRCAGAYTWCVRAPALQKRSPMSWFVLLALSWLSR